MTAEEMIECPHHVMANIVWKNGATSLASFGFDPAGRSCYKLGTSDVMHSTSSNKNQIKEIVPIVARLIHSSWTL